MTTTLRQQAGCWVYERRQAEVAMAPLLSRRFGIDWVDVRNRHERLLRGSEPAARVCDWRDSSWLTVARVFPRVGARLLRHGLRRWPPRFGEPAALRSWANPDVSAVLPLSGADRLAPFRRTLAGLAGQEGVRYEVVVAEEGESSLLAGTLPDAVRHVFLPRAAEAPYGKARMLNAGVAAARGRHVVLLDADILVPCRFLAEVCRCLDSGWDAVRPIRFLFCLDEIATRQVLAGGHPADSATVGDVMQNFPGGSVAVRKPVYSDVGGMDERFREWGGEDLEFLDRLRTRRHYAGGYLPAVHLWHAPAAMKSRMRSHHPMADAIRAQSAMDRIRALAAEPPRHWSP